MMDKVNRVDLENALLDEKAKIERALEIVEALFATIHKISGSDSVRLDVFTQTVNMFADDDMVRLIERVTGASLMRFTGLPMTAAVVECLDAAGSPMTTRQITDELISGGVATKSKNPRNIIYATLDRLSKQGITERMRDQGKWKLREWNDTTSGSGAGRA